VLHNSLVPGDRIYCFYHSCISMSKQICDLSGRKICFFQLGAERRSPVVIIIDFIDSKSLESVPVSDFLNLDEVTSKKVDKLMKRGQELRDALMSGPLANVMLDFVDDVKDLKKMAATMFFLYAAERQSAEHEDRDPDEDFFYAGLNLYKHAVVEQISAEDDDDDFEDLDDDAWDDDEDDE